GRMMIRSTFGFLPQYALLRASSTFWPIVHDTNLNGPVPVGCRNAYVPVGLNVPPVSVAASAPYFFIAVGLCIENDEITSDGKKTPDGRVRLTTIWYLPFVTQLLKSGGGRICDSLLRETPPGAPVDK